MEPDGDITLELAEGYRDMSDTLAGSDLKVFIEAVADAAKENLVFEKEHEEVLRLQGSILACKYILVRFAAAEEFLNESRSE